MTTKCNAIKPILLKLTNVDSGSFSWGQKAILVCPSCTFWLHLSISNLGFQLMKTLWSGLNDGHKCTRNSKRMQTLITHLKRKGRLLRIFEAEKRKCPHGHLMGSYFSTNPLYGAVYWLWCLDNNWFTSFSWLSAVLTLRSQEKSS